MALPLNSVTAPVPVERMAPVIRLPFASSVTAPVPAAAVVVPATSSAPLPLCVMGLSVVASDRLPVVVVTSLERSRPLLLTRVMFCAVSARVVRVPPRLRRSRSPALASMSLFGRVSVPPAMAVIDLAESLARTVMLRLFASRTLMAPAVSETVPWKSLPTRASATSAVPASTTVAPATKASPL